MLKKQYRLPIQDFSRRKAFIKRTQAFTVKMFPSERGYCRVGVVVSRVVASRAVARNRLKRIFFSIIQELWSHLSFSGDILCIMHPSALAMTTRELRDELIIFFKKDL